MGVRQLPTRIQTTFKIDRPGKAQLRSVQIEIGTDEADSAQRQSVGVSALCKGALSKGQEGERCKIQSRHSHGDTWKVISRAKGRKVDAEPEQY
jgi:hypothetical protein